MKKIPHMGVLGDGVSVSIGASHALEPGSTPGRRKLLFFIFAGHTEPCNAQLLLIFVDIPASLAGETDSISARGMGGFDSSIRIFTGNFFVSERLNCFPNLQSCVDHTCSAPTALRHDYVF